MRRRPIVDLFAGGGGASRGIEAALGRGPDIAVNHDADAIAMHEANHPKTRHYRQDVGEVDPRTVTKGRPAWLLWASPDCTHFSRAKGGKPVKKRIRSLAWVAARWAVQNRPLVIILENVREFEGWGPLLPQWKCGCGWKGTEGQATLARTRRRCPSCNSLKISVDYAVMVPDPARKGLTFKRFVGRLRNLGYVVEWKTLNAADFGAPTHRRRLFLIARRDGKPIVWPEPSHGDPKKIADSPLYGEPLKPWRTAAECIDWSIPCPSIFDRKRLLVEATMRRIALGIKRYVLDAVNPFLVVCNHGGQEFRGQDLAEPMPTVTAARDAHGIVTPFLARIGQTGGNGKYVNGADEPVTTITSEREHLLVTPVIASLAHGAGGAKGTFGDSRSYDAREPLWTIHAGGGNHALLTPILVGAGGAANAGKPKPVDEPSTTVLPHDRRAVVAAYLAKHFGGVVGVPVDRPLPTTTARGTQTQVVAANLVHLNRNTKPTGVDDPLHAVTSGGNHAFLVYSFLSKYFGTAIGTPVDDPLPTATGKARFGLVTVTIDGECYVIVDIGMRMLSPRELARAQGFPFYSEWRFEKMTRDEVCVAAIENRDIVVDASAGTVWRTRGPGGVKLAAPELVGGSNVNGYLAMNLTANGTKKQIRLHRLIWIAANGIPADGLIVAHINNDKTDNRLSNLKLLTPAQNSTEAKADGLYKTPASQKLTVEVRRRLAEEYRGGEITQKAVAAKYGISISRVQQILRSHDYILTGTKTSQTHKIGNSVSPPIAEAIVRANLDEAEVPA